MKVYIVSDMECVAGMVNYVDYCRPESKNYEHGRELTTLEVNASVEGLLEGGATEVMVWDGHGPGALNVDMLHPEVKVATGTPLNYPHFLDDSYDAMIFIGQHAKSNTDGGHLSHSGSFAREEWLLNGLSIGEIGLGILKGFYFGVPTVMLSGDKSACVEALELVPSMETVAVIEGQKRGSASGLTEEQNKLFNVGSIHIPPRKSREMIKATAKRCLVNAKTVERFWIEPPYEMVRITRRKKNSPSRRYVNRSDDLIDVLSQAPKYDSKIFKVSLNNLNPFKIRFL